MTCYLTGGWRSAWAGAQALRNKALDVDLLMIVAANGAVAIGQIFDGALLIVIFATSVTGLLDLAPDRAVVVDGNGSERAAPATELVMGDRVVVRPGGICSAATAGVWPVTKDPSSSSRSGACAC